MSIKFLGSLFVFFGCSSIGVSVFLRICERIKILSEFSRFCDKLVSEISFRFTPLPELKANSEFLRGFLQSVNKLYEKGECFSVAWANETAKLPLNKFDKALICDIGETLGQYDTENQTRSLLLIREQLALSHKEAVNERKSKGRCVGAMGVLCGTLLVVVLS